MIVDADGQPRRRRKRRKDPQNALNSSARNEGVKDAASSEDTDEEIMNILRMEQEAELMAEKARECPVPKPKGLIGELLGFKGGERVRRGRREGKGKRSQSDLSGDR